MMRFAWLLAFLLLAAGATAQSAFYDAPRIDARGKPGTLVRAQAMEGAPLNAAAYRVLYRSTSFDGKPILVSGVVIVPQGAPPPGGRPIVAWAHPTSGIVPRCAPSLALFFFQQVQGLRTMVRDGYVVAATDYPGLGTPRPHPYLVGLSEARAVIDSVRVARSLPGAGGGNRFIVWGHSQGGHAALFTGLIAKTYAPELTLFGVAAAAPASELGALMDDDLSTPAGKNITAMTLWSWQRVYGAPMDQRGRSARHAGDRQACEGMYRRPVGYFGPQPGDVAAGATFPHRRASGRYRAVARSAREEYARAGAAQTFRFFSRKASTIRYPARGDAGLFRQALQGRQ